jgi:glutaredoxin
MKVYKLVHTGDFVKCAKQRGITIRLDIRKTSGLQIYWEHTCDDKEAIKNLKQIFKRDGLIAVHHFKKAYVPKKKPVETSPCVFCEEEVEVHGYDDPHEPVMCDSRECLNKYAKIQGGVN